jgi:hypothetical protein
LNFTSAAQDDARARRRRSDDEVIARLRTDPSVYRFGQHRQACSQARLAGLVDRRGNRGSDLVDHCGFCVPVSTLLPPSGSRIPTVTPEAAAAKAAPIADPMPGAALLIAPAADSPAAASDWSAPVICIASVPKVCANVLLAVSSEEIEAAKLLLVPPEIVRVNAVVQNCRRPHRAVIAGREQP